MKSAVLAIICVGVALGAQAVADDHTHMSSDAVVVRWTPDGVSVSPGAAWNIADDFSEPTSEPAGEVPVIALSRYSGDHVARIVVTSSELPVETARSSAAASQYIQHWSATHANRSKIAGTPLLWANGRVFTRADFRTTGEPGRRTVLLTALYGVSRLAIRADIADEDLEAVLKAIKVQTQPRNPLIPKSSYALDPNAPTVILEQAELEHLLEKRIRPSAVSTGTFQAGDAVALDVTVNTNGKVVSVRRINGHPAFADSAMQAVRMWEYQPYLLNGEPANVRGIVVLTFGRPDSRIGSVGPPAR